MGRILLLIEKALGLVRAVFAGDPIALQETKGNKIAEAVERARQGDQVAMAVIRELRKQAQSGVKSAEVGLKKVLKYIEENPSKASTTFSGTEEMLVDPALIEEFLQAVFSGDPAAVVQTIPNVGPNKAMVLLSHGPLIDFENTNKCFADEQEKKAFMLGACYAGRALQEMQKMPHNCQHALLLGYVHGMARRIQDVRDGRKSIRVLSPGAAFELE